MSGAEIIIGVVGAVIAAAGTAVTAVQAQKQAEAQSDIYAQQAAHERKAAAAEEEQFRRDQSRLMAQRRAALGASGVDPGTGSPLLVSEDIAGEVELNALRIRQGGAVRATRLQQIAMLQRQAGSAAATGGFVRAGSLLVGGAADTYGQYIDSQSLAEG